MRDLKKDAKTKIETNNLTELKALLENITEKDFAPPTNKKAFIEDLLNYAFSVELTSSEIVKHLLDKLQDYQAVSDLYNAADTALQDKILKKVLTCASQRRLSTMDKKKFLEFVIAVDNTPEEIITNLLNNLPAGQDTRKFLDEIAKKAIKNRQLNYLTVILSANYGTGRHEETNELVHGEYENGQPKKKTEEIFSAHFDSNAKATLLKHALTLDNISIDIVAHLLRETGLTNAAAMLTRLAPSVTKINTTDADLLLNEIESCAKEGALLKANNLIVLLNKLTFEEDLKTRLSELETICSNITLAADFLKKPTYFFSSATDEDIYLLERAVWVDLNRKKSELFEIAKTQKITTENIPSFPTKTSIAVAVKEASSDIKKYCTLHATDKKAPQQNKTKLLLAKFDVVQKTEVAQTTSSKLKQLDALEAKLKYQENLYTVRNTGKFEYFGFFCNSSGFGKGYSATEKLEETNKMLKEVARLKALCKDQTATTTDQWIAGKAASNDGIIFDSTLTTLYKTLVALGGKDFSKKETTLKMT